MLPHLRLFRNCFPYSLTPCVAVGLRPQAAGWRPSTRRGDRLARPLWRNATPAPAVPPDCLPHSCPLVAVPAVPHRAARPPMALCHLPVVAPRYVLLLHGDTSIRLNLREQLAALCVQR